MKEEIITNVVTKMMDMLDTDGIRKLKMVLHMSLVDYDVTPKKNEVIPYDNTDMVLLKKFADSKIAAGKAKSTVQQYVRQIKLALTYIDKKIDTIDEDDIRTFLYKYQVERGNNNTTLRNMRAYLSSFFNWLRKNRYIKENPMDLVEAIKPDYTIKQPFKDEEITKIKDACKTKRDRAMVDFLDASMVRVGELVGLDKNDIVFTDRECVVYGKGRKERVAYFNGEAKVHLEEYVMSRTDKNPALFVTYGGKNRLSQEGIRSALKRIGVRADVIKVHPHRFRRTGATRSLSAGMPIEELQILMGHSDVKTTLIYGKVDNRKVKFRYNSIHSW